LDTKEKAAQSSVILGNEAFQSMIKDLEEGLILEWRISDNPEHREFCWLKLDALQSILEDLESFIHNDKIENNTK
jgi:hypothetical protein